MRALPRVGLPLALVLLAAGVAVAGAPAGGTADDGGIPPSFDVADATNPTADVQQLLANVEGSSGSGSGDGPGTGPAMPGDPVGFDPGAALADPAVQLTLAVLGGLALAGGAIVGGARILSKDDLLENETRASIYEYLKREVGANLKEITEALDLTTTNAIWHLRKLEEASLVSSDKFNGYKVFYPSEGGIEAKKLSISRTALSNDNARAIFEYVISNPGAHQRQIARALDVNHGTVRWHLKKLRKADLLKKVQDGRASRYFSTDMGTRAMETVVRDGAPGLEGLTSVTPS